MVGIICLLISQNQGFFGKSYGTTRNDYCYSVISTQDNGYAMCGYSGDFLSNGDFLVMKTDSAGAISWAYTYFRSSVAYDEFAWPIVQTTDGSYYVAGHGFVDAMSTENNIVLLKLNSSGGVLWAKSYGNPGYTDYAHTMTKLSDGGLAIAGHGIVNPFPTGQDIVVMKLTPNGDVVWAKQYADTYQDHAYGIIQTSDGGIAVAGFTQRSGSSDFDMLVIRLDRFGNTLWVKAYGTVGVNEHAYSLAQLNDGNLVVAGYTGLSDLILIKVDLNTGDILWTRVYGSGAYDDVAWHSLTKTSDGGCLVPGGTGGWGAGGYYDFLLLKINSAGDPEWARRFGGTGVDYATSSFQKPDGRFVIAGYTDSYTAGGYDFAMLVLQSDGNFPGACVYEFSPTPTSPALSTYTLSQLFDWTYSTEDLSYDRGTPSVTSIQICTPLYENEEENEQRTNPSLWITCSPFPGGASFISSEETNIRIYNADGRLSFSGKLRAGKNRINLERGVYFWKAGNQSGRIAIR